MFKIKILLLLALTIIAFGDNHIFGKSSIIESRTIDGTTYHIVKANADVMNSNTADGTPTGKKSITYNNLLGEVAVSKKDYNNIPNLHNGKVIIYYLIKEGEERKQMHELFFNRKDINFPIYSLDEDYKNYKKDIPYESKSKVSYTYVYIILFILFFILLDFSENRRVYFILFIFQIIIIITFFIGAHRVINIENKECSQNPIETIGTVKYHVSNQPYVIFKNCNGDNSRSQMNISELASYNEYSPVTIYYSQETQHDSADNRGNRFTYKVFFSKEEFFDKSETPLRKKVIPFMIFIWLYYLFHYQNKLTLPSFINKKNNYFKIDPYNPNKHEPLYKISSEACEEENYNTAYQIYTDTSNKIKIKRTDIYSLVVPSVIFVGLLWALLQVLPDIFTGNIPSDETREIYFLTFFIFLLASIFLFISIKNISSVKHFGIFDHTTNTYQALDYDKVVPFKNIYSLTIIYKKISVQRGDGTGYENLFILDLLLENGEVINLVANKHKSRLLAEAKIISSYIDKPILDLGKWNYGNFKG